MCMEDIRIGRKSPVSFRVVSVTNAPTQLCTNAPKRIALIISSLTPIDAARAQNRLTISSDPNVADLGGLVIWGGTTPFKLDVQKYGQIVTTNLFVISDNAAASVGVCEVFQDEQ